MSQPRSRTARQSSAALVALIMIFSMGTVGAAGPASAVAAQQGLGVLADRSRLSAPTNLRVPPLAYDESSITVVWEKPTAHAAIVDYHVYANGTLLGSASDNPTSPAKPYLAAFYADPANSQQVRTVMNNFTATGLRPATRYRFTVRSVDAAGHESPESAPVSQATTPVPKVFDVTAYGAVGDGVTLNTAAIQAAIDACTPGGKVLIPQGVFKTGAIWLHSDMTLEVAAGARLLGSERAEDYPYDYLVYEYSNDTRFYSLINAHTFDYGTISNIRIVGKGIIDGNGWKQNGVNADGFPVAMPSSSKTVGQNGILAKAQVELATRLGNPIPYGTRSNLITMRGVHNVYYGGFTARNPADHTLVNLHSDNVTVNGVLLETYDINNADGVEFIHGNGLTVINSVFDTGDDCVNFGAGLGAVAERGVPTRNAWISNNYFREGHGAVVAGSHTGAWIEDVVAEDNVMNHTDVGLRMKTDPENGGGARRFLFRDNAMKDSTNQAFIFTSAYADKNAAIAVEPARKLALFRDITVTDVTVDGTGKESINVFGVPDQAHQGLRFSNVRFIHANPTNIQYLKDSSFTNVVFDNTANPWVIANSAGLVFDGSTTSTTVTVDAAAAPAWPAGPTLPQAAGPTLPQTGGPALPQTSSALPATAPGGSGLSAVADDVSATLTWPAATDNVAVAGYTIYRGQTPVATVPGDVLSYRVAGLSPALRYDFHVVAVDATGNATRRRLGATVTTTGTGDMVAPLAPVGAGSLTVDPDGLGTTWLRAEWVAATDTYGVAAYRVSAEGVGGGDPTVTATVAGGENSVVLTGLLAGSGYLVSVVAVDDAGNSTAYPTTVRVSTAPRYDTGAPGWPARSSLRATAVTATSVRLTWTPARDDTAVLGYRVFDNGVPLPLGAGFTPVNDVATVTGTSFTVSGLAPGSTHRFTVEAGDAAGRWSGSGPTVRVTMR